MAGVNEHWIYLGVGGRVLALDRATGAEMWRTKLKAGALVNLVCDDRRLYACAQGQAFCLDPGTGTILWKNPLKSLGLGLVSLVAPGGEGNSPFVLQAGEKQRRAQAAAGG